MAELLVGSVIKLDIRKMGINGEGIGYYNKLAIFVPGAIEKETIYAKIEDVKEKYATASISSFIKVSNRRVEPFCKYFEECGACTMQHISHKEQLKIKREILINSLRRYTKLDVSKIRIEKCVESPDLNYRNKSQLPFKDTNFGLALGLYSAGTNKFVYIDNCAIQKDAVNSINEKVLSLLISEDCHTPKEGGELLYLVVRALDSGEAQVTFVLNEYKDKYKRIAEKIIEKYPEIKTVAYSIHDRDDVTVLSDECTVLAGNNYIKDEILSLEVRLSPKSFYQLNKKASELLYKEIIDSDIKEDDVIFDGYSGIGILGLLLSQKAKHVYSVDLSSDSIKNARIIQRQNGIKNITFFSDRIENRFPRLIEEGINPSVVVLDPPRSGLDKKVIESIKNSGARKVYYISCNSSSLAKNLNDLLDKYEI
nr:23S rRNA (uracil(1939)-C(5))-methyltransferase RlmD [Gammaproteobacteria bacterium]